MLTEMITETLMGAMTGYVTNHTAIRSLFQPNGVIEKTRDDFAREAGRLLEDQVLTQTVLAQQLQLPEVQQVLKEALECFLQEKLPDTLGQLRLADLPDYEDSTAFLQQLLVQFLQQEREQILLLLKKHLPVEQVLTEAQCMQLTTQLEQLLSETLQQERFVTQVWHSWQAEKGSFNLEQLGLKPVCEVLIHNLACDSAAWPQRLQTEYGAMLAKLLEESIQRLQLRPLLLEIDKQLEGTVVGQYLHCEADELQQMLCAVLNSEGGKELVAFMTAQIIDGLESVDIPMSQLFPDALMQELTPLLQQQLPLILEELLDWLQQNRQAVDGMLESAIDEVAEELGGMKGMLLQQLKETVLQQVLQQTDFGVLLQQFVLSEQSNQETATRLVNMLATVLQTCSVGELVRRLNQKQQLQDLLQRFLTENLQQLLQQSGTQWMDHLLQMPMDSLMGSFKLAQHQEQIEQWLSVYLLERVVKLDVAALLEQAGGSFMQQPVNQLLQLRDEQLEGFVTGAVQQACRQLSVSLSQCSADALYRPFYDVLEGFVVEQAQQWLKRGAAQFTLQDLLAVLEQGLVQKQPELLQAITDVGLQMTKGRLSKLAEEQIQQLSNEAMLKLVEDFMGQELQPLNYLGAGMGAVAGAMVGTALSAAMPMAGAATPSFWLSALAGKSVVFGAVGYGTNCAAVKGLFWPYEPVGGIELLQGVIPKQKERFAHSMGQLVHRYVINDTVLRQLLQQSQPQWMTYSARIAEDKQFCANLAAQVAAKRGAMVTGLLQGLEQQGITKGIMLLEKLGGMPFAFLRKRALSEFLKNGQLKQQGLSAIEQWVQKQLHSPIALRQFCSANQIWQWISRWAVQLPAPDFVGLSKDFLSSQTTLEKQLGEERMQDLQNAIAKGSVAWLEQKAHSDALAAGFCKYVQTDKFRSWFAEHGELLLKRNLSGLFRFVEQGLLQLLQEKQQTITVAVQQAILNRLGLMQQMGYSMMGGDEIVAQIVERVLRQKLPIFLSVKSRELQEIFAQWCQQQLIPALLDLSIQREQVQGLIQTLLEQPAVHQCVGRVAAKSVKLLAQQPNDQWGKWLQFDNLLEKLQMQFGFQWQMNGNAVVTLWQPLVEAFYEKEIGDSSLKSLTNGFVDTIPVSQVLDFEQLDDLLAAFQMRLQENISITKPQQWLDWPQLLAVMEPCMKGLLQDVAFQQWFIYEGELLILQLTHQWERLLPEASRATCIQPVVKALFTVAEDYGTQLLSAMDLSNLAERQLIAMDSAHLEQVVRGFASQYLVHIENRGWLGAAFALVGMMAYFL